MVGYYFSSHLTFYSDTVGKAINRSIQLRINNPPIELHTYIISKFSETENVFWFTISLNHFHISLWMVFFLFSLGSLGQKHLIQRFYILYRSIQTFYSHPLYESKYTKLWRTRLIPYRQIKRIDVNTIAGYNIKWLWNGWRQIFLGCHLIRIRPGINT